MHFEHHGVTHPHAQRRGLRQPGVDQVRTEFLRGPLGMDDKVEAFESADGREQVEVGGEAQTIVCEKRLTIHGIRFFGSKHLDVMSQLHKSLSNLHRLNRISSQRRNS